MFLRLKFGEILETALSVLENDPLVILDAAVLRLAVVAAHPEYTVRPLRRGRISVRPRGDVWLAHRHVGCEHEGRSARHAATAARPDRTTEGRISIPTTSSSRQPRPSKRPGLNSNCSLENTNIQLPHHHFVSSQGIFHLYIILGISAGHGPIKSKKSRCDFARNAITCP